MMEGLRLDRDAVLWRSVIVISSGGVPLMHDCAVERHLQNKPIDNADEQIAVWKMPHALHRTIGPMDAMDVARLADSEKPSPVRWALAGPGIAAHVEQHHAWLAPMRFAARDAHRRQVL